MESFRRSEDVARCIESLFEQPQTKGMARVATMENVSATGLVWGSLVMAKVLMKAGRAMPCLAGCLLPSRRVRR